MRIVSQDLPPLVTHVAPDPSLPPLTLHHTPVSPGTTLLTPVVGVPRVRCSPRSVPSWAGTLPPRQMLM